MTLGEKREVQTGFAGLCGVAILACLIVGCTTVDRGEAVPKDQQGDAEIPGIPDARMYADGDAGPYIEMGRKRFLREQQQLVVEGHSGPLPPISVLAVSGGGDNGAFGAGLVVGWTAAGTRPNFKLVTGISTGALTAPFAFLGPDYDAQLEDIYTTITADDVFEPRAIYEAVFSDALADTSPLWTLVRRHANQDMLDAIAVEYMKGRALLIGTTDLDAQRPVIWNIGEIAASRDPKALDLFHRILVASAAIPGAFPPVMIDVQADGRTYQEMHVDGGAMAQSFVYPPSLNIAELSKKFGVERERHLYIIRNARLDPEWATVEPHVFSIAGRAISSLIQSQGIGDLYKIYVEAERDGVDYNLAFIPSDFTLEHEGEFDQAYMRALFDYAFDLSRDGYHWIKHPPDFNPTD